jgi:23S rRNA pseudouridine2604 synthase
MTDTQHPTDLIRLDKRLTQLFDCSRREAEQLVEGGWVKVDGEVIEHAQFKLRETQTITLHPDAEAKPVEPATILLHKPAGSPSGKEQTEDAIPALINIHTRLATDPSRIRPLKKHFLHLQVMLPIETAASGLHVFTQDYRVIRKLTDDVNKVEQEFIVDVSGSLEANGLALLNHGLSYAGKPLAPAKVSWQNETRLRFAVKAPQPGQIAHMCQSVGLTLLSMKRIRIGRRSMGNLPVGQWCYLPPYEKF